MIQIQQAPKSYHQKSMDHNTEQRGKVQEGHTSREEK